VTQQEHAFADTIEVGLQMVPESFCLEQLGRSTGGPKKITNVFAEYVDGSLVVTGRFTQDQLTNHVQHF
jgi:hypothetical protein